MARLRQIALVLCLSLMVISFDIILSGRQLVPTDKQDLKAGPLIWKPLPSLTPTQPPVSLNVCDLAERANFPKALVDAAYWLRVDLKQVQGQFADCPGIGWRAHTLTIIAREPLQIKLPTGVTALIDLPKNNLTAVDKVVCQSSLDSGMKRVSLVGQSSDPVRPSTFTARGLIKLTVLRNPDPSLKPDQHCAGFAGAAFGGPFFFRVLKVRPLIPNSR